HVAHGDHTGTHPHVVVAGHTVGQVQPVPRQPLDIGHRSDGLDHHIRRHHRPIRQLHPHDPSSPASGPGIPHSHRSGVGALPTCQTGTGSLLAHGDRTAALPVYRRGTGTFPAHQT